VDEPPDGGVALAFALLLLLLLLPHPARAITPTSGIKIIQLRIKLLLKLFGMAEHMEKRPGSQTY
jgi:hypothetical protein